jgi:type II restriction enzyme
MMVVEDAPGSQTPVTDQSPHFEIFPEFKGASYLKRYDLLCQRLVQEQLYSTASVISSERTGITTGAYSNLSDLTSLRTFVSSLAAHIAGEAARIGDQK